MDNQKWRTRLFWGIAALVIVAVWFYVDGNLRYYQDIADKERIIAIVEAEQGQAKTSVDSALKTLEDRIAFESVKNAKSQALLEFLKDTIEKSSGGNEEIFKMLQGLQAQITTQAVTIEDHIKQAKVRKKPESVQATVKEEAPSREPVEAPVSTVTKKAEEAPVTAVTEKAEEAPIAKKGEQAQFLEAHNEARKKVGVKDLKWSTELEERARKWGLLLAEKGCKMAHERTSDGENLSWASASVYPDGTRVKQEVTPAKIVKQWTDEVEYYDPTSGKCEGGVCGHFTQAMWGTSQYLGCAIVPCENKEQLAVCKYFPAGNWEGEKPF